MCDAKKGTAPAPEADAKGGLPDLGALALGSLLMQAKSDSPHRERTAEERRAGIADLVRAMEKSMEE